MNVNVNDSPLSCAIVIVGGGVAGTSSAVALWRAGVRDIVLLERGELGHGDRTGIGPHQHARRSGSAVMDASEARRVKMIVNLYAASTALFAAHHGLDGARRYLRAARRGIARQLALAREVGADVLQLGSLYVAQSDSDVVELEREFLALQSVGADGVALWSAAQVRDATGANFPRAIFFPHDAVIDSAQYARLLMQHAAPGVRVREHCSPVVDVRDDDDNGGAVTTLADGTVYRSKHALVATGGLFVPRALAGVLTPCYSFLVALPQIEPAQLSENTPNIFTWGFTHDLCMTRGWMRVSGADHFSALKPPRDAERCAELAAWTCEWYRGKLTADGAQTQYGVYSETPDRAPLVGPLRRGSAVHYLLGCQAWGQAILSALAASMPAVMGVAAWTSAEERDEYEALFGATRFSIIRE